MNFHPKIHAMVFEIFRSQPKSWIYPPTADSVAKKLFGWCNRSQTAAPYFSPNVKAAPSHLTHSCIHTVDTGCQTLTLHQPRESDLAPGERAAALSPPRLITLQAQAAQRWASLPKEPSHPRLIHSYRETGCCWPTTTAEVSFPALFEIQPLLIQSS